VLSVGGLFSGIGGLELGLERAGMRVLWHCEQDPFCRAVLKRHWPDNPCFPDVREVRGAEVPRVDVLCGGFPCQDVSAAGRRAGILGERSGLWAEFSRLVRELRPRYVLVENVPGLLVRGLGDVLGDLADDGYDAEWDGIPAAAVGAPHLRARLWILAYPRGVREQADDTVCAGRALAGFHPGWDAEPAVARVADGLPGRVDVGALGNAVVPHIPELIGRRIIDYERNGG
jgi:DNA (cytosine-5)-methyltransferase 1